MLGFVVVVGSLPFCLAHVRRFAPASWKAASTSVSSSADLLLEVVVVVDFGCLIYRTKAAAVVVGFGAGIAEGIAALFLDFGFVGFELEDDDEEEEEEGSSEDPDSDPCVDFLVPAFDWEHFLLLGCTRSNDFLTALLLPLPLNLLLLLPPL